MIEYDEHKPLVSLHIPKCAGTSMVGVLRQWFGRRLLLHYIDRDSGRLPHRHRLRRWPRTGAWKKRLCIHGHFARLRGFGAWDYYPEVDQFITILRDPLERAVSLFFYAKNRLDWRARRNPMLRELVALPSYDLERFLCEYDSRSLSMFPIELNASNFQEFMETYFIYIGVAEDMETSVTRLAGKLGFPPPIRVGRENVTPRNEQVSNALRKQFIENHPLEYAIYDYARAHYKD